MPLCEYAELPEEGLDRKRGAAASPPKSPGPPPARALKRRRRITDADRDAEERVTTANAAVADAEERVTAANAAAADERFKRAALQRTLTLTQNEVDKWKAAAELAGRKVGAAELKAAKVAQKVIAQTTEDLRSTVSDLKKQNRELTAALRARDAAHEAKHAEAMTALTAEVRSHRKTLERQAAVTAVVRDHRKAIERHAAAQATFKVPHRKKRW